MKIVTMTSRKNGQVQQERSTKIRRLHRQVQLQERSIIIVIFVRYLVCHLS